MSGLLRELGNGFLMKFPDARSSLPMSHYISMTSLSRVMIKKVMSEQVKTKNNYSPTANIEKFDLVKRELVVKYYAGPERICNLILSVASSGNNLELKRIERQEN